MSKIPRDIDGKGLCKFLGKYEYKIIRQTGSHIRLTSHKMGYDHSITIPNHNPVKIGTINKILDDVSNYLKKEKAELVHFLKD